MKSFLNTPVFLIYSVEIPLLKLKISSSLSGNILVCCPFLHREISDIREKTITLSNGRIWKYKHYFRCYNCRLFWRWCRSLCYLKKTQFFFFGPPMAAIPTLRLSELPGWALGGARTVVCQEIKSENSGWKSTVGCKWLLANKPFALLQLIHSYLPVRLTHLTGHH